MPVEYIYEEMHDNVDNEVFVIDMDEYPGYAIHSNGDVENTDTSRILKPSKDSDGYYLVHLKNRAGKYKTVKIHKLIGKYYIKNPDTKPCVDHIDGNPSNNDYRNLRWATHQENNRNRSKPSHNTSGHIGVSWNKKAKKWHVRICVDGKNLNIGYYPDINDAIRARAEQVELRFGEYGKK